jgi:hypothetical protein
MLGGSLCYFRQMDKRITRYNSLNAMKSARATKDLDILIGADAENSKAV